MRIFSAFLVVAFVLLSCGNQPKKESPQPESADMPALVSYQFKVDGIQDEAIKDSIFHLHFRIEGIDEMVISSRDCTVVFTVDPDLLNKEGLRKAIEMQGGKVLN